MAFVCLFSIDVFNAVGLCWKCVPMLIVASIVVAIFSIQYCSSVNVTTRLSL